LANKVTGTGLEAARAFGAQAAAASIPACAGGWLCLYEHIDGGGRRLIFREDSWQNLGPYDFARQTSSWRNNLSSGDYARLSNSLSNPNQHQISINGQTYASRLGSYNDWAIQIQG